MAAHPLRCFVAVPVPPTLRSALVEAGAAIREHDAGWRGEKWVAPENLHLTLRFIGDVAADQLEELANELGAAVQRAAPFDIPYSRLRATPSVRRARMIWAEFLDPDGQCGALVAALESTLVGQGFPPEPRPFAPHITLCRARRARHLKAQALEVANPLVEGVTKSMSVPFATLFTSRLAPRGPVYTEAATWRLMGERPRFER